ncbi:hypothetical protein O4H52_12295 [Sphingomonadaceae bacterium G21617-S1]|jgi:hypothetical protein|uniref:hypothetical protein n=1 Tax=Rhizorhabdus sp. TaxID=1968843 RepID=UPI0019A48243|nr:hypothetical protein [Rhizorhabdus sp.]MBD3760898.1 hypothetical protein [Rhizorhabdus sp.]MCZ4342393.1 hypothetical protein [Sphingomonadaceae bacterium G21617-S1]
MMNLYRLYILDSLGEHIEDCVEIDAANDADAITTASDLSCRNPAELWAMARKVRGFSDSRSFAAC